jgi:hypothetical protein
MKMIVILFTVLCIYLTIRGYIALQLQCRVIDGCYGYLQYRLDQLKFSDPQFNQKLEEIKNEELTRIEEIVGRYSLLRMAFDFRPITLESWYEENEVNLIKRYENYK